ncbi:hypothetical protein L4C37_21610 [Vibrio kagoshimensis]|uniref:hypothetical protein n=1 Tax=Vibrio kagoshimensis TaxID=2910244 RepID=UPI003D1A17F1
MVRFTIKYQLVNINMKKLILASIALSFLFFSHLSSANSEGDVKDEVINTMFAVNDVVYCSSKSGMKFSPSLFDGWLQASFIHYGVQEPSKKNLTQLVQASWALWEQLPQEAKDEFTPENCVYKYEKHQKNLINFVKAINR